VVSSELLSAFLSLMPDAAMAVDGVGMIISVNERAEELFGYPGGLLPGLSVEMLLPERARRRDREHRSGFLTDPAVRPIGVSLELTGRRSDGSEFPFDISLAPLANAGEHLVIAAVRDVTEIRAATAAQAELAAIVRSSLDAIISTSLDGHITNWNPSAEDLLGYPRSEIIGRHIAELVPDEASATLEELLDTAVEGVHGGARDTRWRHRDGHDVDVAISISPVRDHSGALHGFSAIARDISERKRSENQLRGLLAKEEHQMRQHGATAEIRLALLSGTQLQNSLTLICEQAVDLLGAATALISTEETPSGFGVLAAVGLAQEMSGASFGPGASPIDATVEPTDRGGRPRDAGNRPTLGIPVVVGPAGVAMMTVAREAGSPEFSDSDRSCAASLGDQAALAFEFERARLDREQIALVGDRERIARDLHDLVIQRLFATGMGLQSLLPLIDEETVQGRVSDAVVSLDETIQEIRNTIFGLSNLLPDAGQVREPLLDLVRRARETLGFEPSIRFDGPVDIGIPHAVIPHALAVVREALSNAARHARATEVEVRVSLLMDRLVVSVTDDGIGVPPYARSSGLGNLEARAELLGGHFECSKAPKGGTRLNWQVPITH